MHAAALTRNIDSHCPTRQRPARHLQVLPIGSFITAQNPNEIKQVILKI